MLWKSRPAGQVPLAHTSAKRNALAAHQMGFVEFRYSSKALKRWRVFAALKWWRRCLKDCGAPLKRSASKKETIEILPLISGRSRCALNRCLGFLPSEFLPSNATASLGEVSHAFFGTVATRIAYPHPGSLTRNRSTTKLKCRVQTVRGKETPRNPMSSTSTPCRAGAYRSRLYPQKKSSSQSILSEEDHNALTAASRGASVVSVDSAHRALDEEVAPFTDHTRLCPVCAWICTVKLPHSESSLGTGQFWHISTRESTVSMSAKGSCSRGEPQVNPEGMMP